MKQYSIRKLAGIILAAALGLSVTATLARAQQSAVREACAADYKALCPNVQRGGGRIVACLKDNADKLSAGCQKALMAAKAAQ